MLDDLKSVGLFVSVVDLGSFRAAAKKHNLSPSVVSYHIKQIEDRYGAALLYRSTRNLTPTHDGFVFLEKAREMISKAEEAFEMLNSSATSPSGQLHISLPTTFVHSQLTRLIAQFSKQNPKIKLNISYNDHRQDLIRERLDMAFRAGEMADSNLVTRKVTDIHRCLVGTPDLLKKFKSPRHPNELIDWPWVKLSMMPAVRHFKQKSQIVEIKPNASLETDNILAMCEFTRSGLGISTPPVELIESDLKEGRLIHVLEGWTPVSVPLYAVWHQNTPRKSLCHLLLDFVISGYADKSNHSSIAKYGPK
ncbi:MAG: LysR family transcriptional regulator [Alphaproteobacteria bacterium]|nr:LysR family transcriptional regulator [Alphaproteobacteria bacterium]